MLDKCKKTIPFVSMLVAFLLVINIAIVYNQLQKAETRKNQMIQTLYENEWEEFLLPVINENIHKSKIQAQYISDNIEKELLEAYEGNLSELKYDIDNHKTDTKFANILNNNLKDKYINVENDNNDLFVANSDKIFIDKSLNCSKNGQSRTWEIEKDMHYNKYLFTDALDKIINESDKLIAWEFLESRNKNHQMIKYASFNNLKNVFMQEGIEGLKTYEFLNPAYINTKEDMFGTDIVDNTGNKTNNYQLVVIQGFNLVDRLNQKYGTQLKYYELKGQKIIDDYVQDKTYINMVGLLFMSLIFVTFVSIIKIQNSVLES